MVIINFIDIELSQVPAGKEELILRNTFLNA
jgi:hypothetical protein